MAQFVFGLLLCACVVFAKADFTQYIPPLYNAIHVLEGGECSVGFTRSESVGGLSVSKNFLIKFTVDANHSTVHNDSLQQVSSVRNASNGKGVNIARTLTVSLTANATWQLVVQDGSIQEFKNHVSGVQSVTVYVYPKDSVRIYPDSSTIVSPTGSAQRIGYHAHPAIRKCYYQMENGEGGSFDTLPNFPSNRLERGATDFIFTHGSAKLCQIYVTYPENATELRFTITASNGQTNISSETFTLKYYQNDHWTYQPVVEVKDDVNVNLVCYAGNQTLSDCYFEPPKSRAYVIQDDSTDNFSYGLDMDKGVCRIQIKKLSPEHYGLWRCVYQVGFGSSRPVSSTVLVKKADSSTS